MKRKEYKGKKVDNIDKRENIKEEEYKREYLIESEKYFTILSKETK